jgi:hemoglobin-like flavoprotein
MAMQRACVVRAADGCALSWLHRTPQAAALFYGRLFEIAPAVKPLLRGDMTEQGCKLMATLGVVVNSLGNLEAVLPAASALAKRHVDYGVKAADYTPVGAALLWTLEQNLGLR